MTNPYVTSSDQNGRRIIMYAVIKTGGKQYRVAVGDK